MKSFLTGSRVYGVPKSDSDIDLVVLVNEDDIKKLLPMADGADGHGGCEHYEDGVSLRFGKLNLLCVTKERHFELWRRGTNEIKEHAPVTRDFAITYLANLRKQNHIDGW